MSAPAWRRAGTGPRITLRFDAKLTRSRCFGFFDTYREAQAALVKLSASSDGVLRTCPKKIVIFTRRLSPHLLHQEEINMIRDLSQTDLNGLSIPQAS